MEQNTQVNRSHRLAMYTLAAGAAASGSTAMGEVIYSGVQNISINQFSALNLNLDGDAYADIRLKNYVFGGNYQGASVIFGPGQLVGFKPGLAYVTALGPTSIVGPSNIGPTFYGSLAYGAGNPNAQFNTASNAFIGLSFPSGSDLYYGWVRVSINNAAGTFVVHDWAYENVSGTPIAIPEPTLGLFAAGAAGLMLLRRGRAA